MTLETLKHIANAAKLGLVSGNLVALIAGYGYGLLVGGSATIVSLIVAVVSTGAVMSSACITNNIFDRRIDAKMNRTRKRSIASGELSVATAWSSAIVLLLVGLTLSSYLSVFITLLNALGWVLYAFVYTYAKRRTYHATLIGTIPGSIPPLIGYFAAEGTSIVAAVVLFAIIAGWQMVHFYAIALVRVDDYAQAKIPVISVVRGPETTLRHSAYWYVITASMLVASMVFAPYVYWAVLAPLIVWWLWGMFRVSVRSMQPRQMFVQSLNFLMLYLLVVWLSYGLTFVSSA